MNEEFLNDMAACYKAKTAGSEGRKALQNALLAPVKEEKDCGKWTSRAPPLTVPQEGERPCRTCTLASLASYYTRTCWDPSAGIHSRTHVRSS